MKVEDVKHVLTDGLPGIDDDTLEYFTSLLTESETMEEESNFTEAFVPFIESYGLADSTPSAETLCSILFQKLKSIGLFTKNNKTSIDMNDVQLLDKAISLSTVASKTFSQTEQAAIDNMWGFDSIRSKRNETIEMNDAGSARYERKAAKEQKKWLEDLENKFNHNNHDNDHDLPIDDENAQISAMTLPDFSGNNRERDIQVNNITITFGGKLLLEGADLRFAYSRRYGLVGRNGIGKTTLLKHMANFDIEGFPRHHRVLHVKQEVQSSNKTVLQVVLESDVERANLLKRQKELSELQQTVDDIHQLQAVSEELTEIYERMNLIGVDTAESRAAIILSGLRFTEDMQHSTTSSLSGGWLMRVALASALFIEPDVLMLDEPTNHLDLEAVIWLQTYLLQYPHTIILVSHDREFLNEVCTDIILFKDLKLQYFKGNFDTFETVRNDMQNLQQKQHEAQKEKLMHMQEFVDKFRFNAKRASLVQSRIKSMNKEVIIEEVLEDSAFQFSFPDSGQLGQNVIKLQEVAFGYPLSVKKQGSATHGKQGSENDQGQTKFSKDDDEENHHHHNSNNNNNNTIIERNMLFQHVDLCIEQSSRIALVGPNGAGKSTLLNLILTKIKPTEGLIYVNPQLRLAIFTQHHLDSFDLTLSPLQNMMNRWPLINESEFRAHLGKYEITGNDALKPMKFSSGGQKSRVAFACLTFAKPHIVLLDEPTNHLDMGAIEALIGALNGFTGGLMVISHDQYFIKRVCKEIWVVGGGNVKQFNGSFDDYKKVALAATNTNMTGVTGARANPTKKK